MNRIATRRTLFAATLSAALAAPVLAQDGMAPTQNQPPQSAPATKPATRSIMDIQSDSMAIQAELAKSMTNPAVLTDPKLRDEVAPAVVPEFKKLLVLMDEAVAIAPGPLDAAEFRAGKYRVMSLLVGFGDKETIAALEAEQNPEAGSSLAVGRFIAAGNEDEKLAAVKQLDTLADANPENLSVGQAAISMYQLAGKNAPRASEAAAQLINTKLKGMVGASIQQSLSAIQQQEKAAREFQAKFMEKPLAIDGTTLSGQTFSSAQWKGRVVMVDFWATWCPPCIAALPKVKEDYKKYHDQGFEIVSISLDQSAEALKQFLAANPEMTWTQIYTEGNPQASAQIAEKLGLQAVPTVFLLDKNGVVRAMAVGGGEEMEKLYGLIPELLKEQPKAEAQ